MCEFAILYLENNVNSFDFDYFGAKGNQLFKILDEKNFFVSQMFNNIHVQVGFLFVVYFVTTFLRYETNKIHCCIHLCCILMLSVIAKHIFLSYVPHLFLQRRL